MLRAKSKWRVRLSRLSGRCLVGMVPVSTSIPLRLTMPTVRSPRISRRGSPSSLAGRAPPGHARLRHRRTERDKANRSRLCPPRAAGSRRTRCSRRRRQPIDIVHPIDMGEHDVAMSARAAAATGARPPPRVVRHTRVSTSTLRKVKGNGGIVGASQGVENPGVRMSSTVRRSRPPRRRSFPLMRLPGNVPPKQSHLFKAADRADR